MTKKRSSEILGVKMDIFPKNTSFRNVGPRKINPPPQTRRQVSATAIEQLTYLLIFASTKDQWKGINLKNVEHVCGPLLQLTITKHLYKFVAPMNLLK